MRRSNNASYGWLAGGGEMGERIRAFDWANTPLGSLETWPQSLRSAISILLPSRAQIVLFWGRDLITFYNDAYAPVLGGKHPRALGLPARECWSEIWRSTLEPLFTQVLDSGEAFYAKDHLFCIERNGYAEETYFDVSYDPVREESGAVGGIFCIVSETTQRVIGERRLRILRQVPAATAEAKSADQACQLAAEVLAQNAHDVSFALIYLLAADGKHARLAASAGIQAGDVASSEFIDLQAPVPAEDFWRFPEVLAGGSRKRTGLQIRTRQRKGPWPETTHTAMVLPFTKGGQEEPVGFLVAGASPRRAFDDAYQGFFELLAGSIAADITNAQAFEAEKKRAEALAELDRAKTAFFSNVSHEFRTPLTLMLGPIEELKAQFGRAGSSVAAPEYRQLDLVQRNGLRLLKLVNTLLDFSRIEAGRTRAVYEETDLAALTAELASVFRSAIEKAGLKLIVDCPLLPEGVYVDREMWEKIVLNLLSNAFKFTFQGEIEVNLRESGKHVELSVRDTGTGIPEDQLGKIFERFHRVPGVQGRTHEGTGIGLALVQELARLHGGSVSVESVYGKGSTFRVFIPIGKSHLPHRQLGANRTQSPTPFAAAAPFVEEALHWLPLGAESATVSVAPAGISLAVFPRPLTEKPRILLADDNADMRQYVTRLLSEHYQVISVPDGAAALAAAREQRPDLVLTDVMMPKLDGFGLMRELRNDPQTRIIPIILVSARAGEESRVEGIEKGADDYLIKPFSARELLARVGARLEMARLRHEAEQRVTGILETLTDGFQVVDAAGRFTYMNPAARRMFAEQGVNAEDLIGKHVLDEAFPESRDTPAGDAFLRAMRERVMVEVDNFYAPWQRWYAIRTHPSSDGGISILFQDITQRKQAEVLRESQKQALQLLAEGAPLEDVLGFLIDVVERHSAEGMLASIVPLNEAGTHFLRGIGPSLPDGFNAAVEGVPVNSPSGLSACAVTRREPIVAHDFNQDPEWQPFRKFVEPYGLRSGWSTPIVSSSGQILGTFANYYRTVGDPTPRNRDLVDTVIRTAAIAIERKRTEAARARLAAVVESSENAIITKDLNSVITTWNRGAERLFGYTAQEAVGQPVTMLIPLDHLDEEPSILERIRRGEAIEHYETVRRRKDGTLFDISLTLSPIKNERGQIIGASKIARDITERKRAGEKLEATVAERTAALRETVGELEAFSYSVAHDLRAPLRAMHGFANLLLQETRPKLDRQEQRHLEQIARSATRLDDLIQDVLNYTRISRAHAPLTGVDLDQLVRDMLASYPAFQAPKAAVTIEGTLPAVLGNTALLTQSISNLLSNAVKFATPGVTPKVRIWSEPLRRGVPAEPRSLSLSHGEGPSSSPSLPSVRESGSPSVRILFQDNGIGIAPENHSRIFRMFERLNPTSEFEGTGIGLTIVRKAVQRMGGQAGFASQPGKGSTFWIDLRNA